MNLDEKILKALHEAGQAGVSGGELARHLGLGRAAVLSHIQDLRALGYDIPASPHGGYRLLSAPDALHADDLQAQLSKSKIIGRDIRVFRQTTSTNDLIEKLARDGAKEGVVIFAEAQTKARGRMGRKWFAPAGKGLWFSMLLRPSLAPQEVTQLTVASATALRRAIESETELRPEIKWPNDLLISGRKVAGILTEMNAELDRVKYVIVGIGVDVNQVTGDFPPELRKSASSLRVELGRPVSRSDLAVAILRELDRDYARVCHGRFGAVADEWERACSTIGRDVVIHIGGRQLRGCAEALGEDGALLLRSEHGHLERVLSGDLSLAG